MSGVEITINSNIMKSNMSVINVKNIELESNEIKLSQKFNYQNAIKIKFIALLKSYVLV